MTFFIVAFTLTTGILIPHVEKILAFTGSTAGMLISMIVPSIIYMRVLPKAAPKKAKLILFFGLILMFVGTLNVLSTSSSSEEAITQILYEKSLRRPEMFKIDSAIKEDYLKQRKLIEEQIAVQELKLAKDEEDLKKRKEDLEKQKVELIGQPAKEKEASDKSLSKDEKGSENNGDSKVVDTKNIVEKLSENSANKPADQQKLDIDKAAVAENSKVVEGQDKAKGTGLAFNPDQQQVEPETAIENNQINPVESKPGSPVKVEVNDKADQSGVARAPETNVENKKEQPNINQNGQMGQKEEAKYVLPVEPKEIVNPRVAEPAPPAIPEKVENVQAVVPEKIVAQPKEQPVEAQPQQVNEAPHQPVDAPPKPRVEVELQKPVDQLNDAPIPEPAAPVKLDSGKDSEVAKANNVDLQPIKVVDKPVQKDSQALQQEVPKDKGAAENSVKADALPLPDAKQKPMNKTAGKPGDLPAKTGAEDGLLKQLKETQVLQEKLKVISKLHYLVSKEKIVRKNEKKKLPGVNKMELISFKLK